MSSNKRYYGSLVSKNWNDGLALCNRYNLSLATVASTTEASTLKSLLPTVNFWVGISDSNTEGVYKNYNDDLNVKALLNWAVGEPNNAGGAEDCVSVGNGAYNDYGCNQYLRVICEVAIPSQSAATVVENLVEITPPSNLFNYAGDSSEFIDSFELSFCKIRLSSQLMIPKSITSAVFPKIGAVGSSSV